MKEVICYVRMIIMNDSDELTLRPTEDYAFKRLFGWEDGKKEVLIYSLTSSSFVTFSYNYLIKCNIWL